MKKISYGRQSIDGKDISEVADVLKSYWITQGPKVAEFERALKKYCGAKYAVAVSSGTAALHIACLAAGLKKGDEAITSPMTFVATSNAVIYTGATPVFADIDRRTFNIDPDEITKRISRRTKAILPVHFAGLPCDMGKIRAIAKNKKLFVIEDACHALGAQYKYRNRWIKVGSCEHSDMTVFSFHPVKTITTGEGGAITTNSEAIYEKLLSLRSHGIYKDGKMAVDIGPWFYEMRDLGYNYRITDFQCALGLSQLKKINSFLEKRSRIAYVYNKEFKSLADTAELPYEPDGIKHAHHLYIIKVDFEKIKSSRKNVMEMLKRAGILTQVHYVPVYRHPYYQKNYRIAFRDYPVSESYYDRALSLPIYPGIKTADLRYIVSRLKKVLG